MYVTFLFHNIPERNPHIKSFWKEYSFLIYQGYTKYNIPKFQTYRCMLYVINVTVSFDARNINRVTFS